MSDRRFQIILIVISVIGIIATLLHVIFAIMAYRNSSIIQFVAREYWP
ncbi:MAG: hypothetical protein J5950_07335 [Clostridia bacterium]|nr:hypothetical protein [Clostridia bacterium]